ncbi:MAG: YgiQ family radical SAM protein [Treponema sp.]|nr:YgiQ family radical SAM protein [Treponema sp.]
MNQALKFKKNTKEDSHFLPVSKKEAEELGWSEVDFVFVSGDAYIDHPSFAPSLLGRLLEKNGYKVGIIPQPDVNNSESFKIFGRPRLAFLVSAGAMDSMVSNYTANKKLRSSDAYSHGGMSGKRPDRATIVYVSKIRQAFKNIPVIIGGIEASLRRCAHYDYWTDKIRRSILLDSKADLLLYGMGEHSILQVASLLNKGIPIKQIKNVKGSVWTTGKKEEISEFLKDSSQKESLSEKKVIFLPSFEEVSENSPKGKHKFAESFLIQEQNTDSINASILIEQTDSRFIVQNPPSPPLSQQEFDQIMELPYQKKWHPIYDKPCENGKTGVPALQEVLFDLQSVRGCFGSCSFCAITFHQGRTIQARSHESIIKEAIELTKRPDFKGYIHDVGGPTANFRKPSCKKQLTFGVCKNRQCLSPKPCENLEVSHEDYIQLLRKLRKIPGIKKIFIRSGIRFDYLMLDKDKTFLEELCKFHISGQLKVAPENVSDKVLSLMRKSSHSVYEKFETEYAQMNKKLGKKQYLVPYYIASHPGSTLKDALETAKYLKKTGFVPDQIQDFYPTPGSLSTCQYYTELDPYSRNPDGTFKSIYVPKKERERKLQRALIQFNKKENKNLVLEAMKILNENPHTLL